MSRNQEIKVGFRDLEVRVMSQEHNEGGSD